MDMAREYGAIVKDLTDPEELLHRFELRLRGRKIDKEGKEVQDPLRTQILPDDIAAQFVDFIRSTVNLNTHYTAYTEDEIRDILVGNAQVIIWWQVMQAEKFPLYVRLKLLFEALNLISSSLHKAGDSTILKWSKGSFQDNGAPVQPERASLLERIFPSFGGRRRQ